MNWKKKKKCDRFLFFWDNNVIYDAVAMHTGVYFILYTLWK